MNKIANYLIKKAKNVKKETDDATNALRAYESKPSDKTLKDLAGKLEVLRNANPTHFNGGYYAGTKDLLSRSNEMIDRGNYVRGLLGKYVGTPVVAGIETVASPLMALDRAMSPYRNAAFNTENDLLLKHPIADLDSNLRTARELLPLYSASRPDPTRQFEGIENSMRRYKTFTPESISTGKPIKDVRLSMLQKLDSGAGAVLNSGVSDLLSVPHTALLNSLGWNGKPRDEYEDEQIAKNKK